MLRSIGWLVWLMLPVFALAFHYGPGQSWLARDRAASLIATATSQSAAATEAQAKAYETQFRLIDARRKAFAAGVDWQSQSEHPLAQPVIAATETQATAYEQAAESWQQTAESYGLAIASLLKVADQPGRDPVEFAPPDRQLLESLRWAEARAMVRSGQVFGGIEQLQSLLDLRTDEEPSKLPTDAIREELAAAQYVGARLLREEGRPQEVWRPVANAARQHYRYLSAAGNNPKAVESVNAPNESADSLNRDQRLQRNLEQVLNLEQVKSEQLEGLPLPRSAPLARRPGDGDGVGKQPGKGPLRDGPPNSGASVPGPMGDGW